MKKGFTLAELLAVIVLLALLMSVSYPLFLNQFEEKKNQIDDYKLELIYSAAENYVKSNINTYPYKVGNTVCLYVKDLMDQSLIKVDVDEIAGDKLLKLVMKGNNDFNTNLVDTCTSSNDVTYKTKTSKDSFTNNNVLFTNDIIYYFENDILVREIDNITIQNQDENSNASYNTVIINYKDLYRVLNRDGVYTTFDQGESFSRMYIDINYQDKLYQDDLENVTVYNNASGFKRYNKGTTLNQMGF